VYYRDDERIDVPASLDELVSLFEQKERRAVGKNYGHL
jgi:hypothetical protein